MSRADESRAVADAAVRGGEAAAPSRSEGRPLAGLRVIELAHVMAGPVCGRMLADLGADVVKVEPPGTGDPARAFASRSAFSEPPGPARPAPSRAGAPGPAGGQGAAFAMLNRNKRGAAIDIKSREGAAAMRRMFARCDVVIENFRPGTMERLGFGWESLRSANPRLVYCGITGFGRSGPLANRPGFDLIAQGMTGLLGITGEGPDRPPVKCGPPLTDVTAGILAAMGVLAALYDRRKTGCGRRVDTSLYEAGIAQTFWHSAVALATGESPGPLGSAHPLAAPYEAFPTKDAWITVGAWNQVNWLRLVEAMEMPELAKDPRFATNEDRVANLGRLREALGARFAQAEAAEWLRRLEAASVPAGPVSSIGDMLRHPQTLAAEMVVPAPDAGGAGKTLGMPVKLSENSAPIGRPSPCLGQHTREVLADYGFSDSEADAVCAS